jgi:hypothetical protein
MKKDHYSSFDEWKKDYERYTAHPNDKHLMAYVVKCTNNSSDTIKKQIKEYLNNFMLETNPWMVFTQISKEHPNHKLFIKNKNDPWFSA